MKQPDPVVKCFMACLTEKGFGSQTFPFKLNITSSIYKIHYIKIDLYYVKCLKIKTSSCLDFSGS